MHEIKPIKIENGMKVSELVDSMGNAGFGAKKIYDSSRIMKKMFEDRDCRVFLGIAGAMVPGGMREIIIDMLDRVDVLVVTGATLTHDLIESVGDSHFQCSEFDDDVELNE